MAPATRPRPSVSFTSLSDPKYTIGVPGNRIAVLDVDGTLEHVYELQIRLLIEPRECWSSEQRIVNESKETCKFNEVAFVEERSCILHMPWNTYRLECHSVW